jgi:hypothetical protein
MNLNVEYSGGRLSYVIYHRKKFDPADRKDLAEYKYFLDHGSWKSGCPFWLEWPFLTIPDMVKDKLVRYVLK